MAYIFLILTSSFFLFFLFVSATVSMPLTLAAPAVLASLTLLLGPRGETRCVTLDAR